MNLPLRAACPNRTGWPSPMTICDTIADGHYGRRADMAMAFAEILNAEARELEAAGVDVIQFDEPAFNVFMEDVKEWGVDALHRACEGLTCTTAVHMTWPLARSKAWPPVLLWCVTAGNAKVTCPLCQGKVEKLMSTFSVGASPPAVGGMPDIGGPKMCTNCGPSNTGYDRN